MSAWRSVDALRSANAMRAAKARVAGGAERAHRAYRLVWRHFRKLSADLAIACLTAGYESEEQLTAVQKHMPQVDPSPMQVAADWLAEQGITWRTPVEKVPPRMTQWRPMTQFEVELALMLADCRFAPATFDKRFARDIGNQARSTERLISPKQSAVLATLGHRYRKQIHGLRLQVLQSEAAHG